MMNKLLNRNPSQGPPIIPPTVAPRHPANGKVVPPDDPFDVANAPTQDDGEMVAVDTPPTSIDALSKTFARASQALEAAANSMSTFPANHTLRVEGMTQAQGGVVRISLKGPAIRGFFIAYGLSSTPTTFGAINVYVGTVPNGFPLAVVNPGTFQTICPGENIFELCIMLPGGLAGTTPISGVATCPLTLVASDDVWAPSYGKIV